MPINKSWHDYNELLIEGGRILMDIGVIRSWNKEIRNMNEGKVGAPFEYSHSYIHFLIKKLGYEGWKQLKYVGRRRIAEIVFSSIKRVLGENPLSKKFKGQKVEAGLKVMLYNKFISL